MSGDQGSFRGPTGSAGPDRHAPARLLLFVLHPTVFLRDLVAETTVRVSVTEDGAEGDDSSYAPSFSPDGRRLAFVTRASTPRRRPRLRPRTRRRRPRPSLRARRSRRRSRTARATGSISCHPGGARPVPPASPRNRAGGVTRRSRTAAIDVTPEPRPQRAAGCLSPHPRLDDVVMRAAAKAPARAVLFAHFVRAHRVEAPLRSGSEPTSGSSPGRTRGRRRTDR